MNRRGKQDVRLYHKTKNQIRIKNNWCSGTLELFLLSYSLKPKKFLVNVSLKEYEANPSIQISRPQKHKKYYSFTSVKSNLYFDL